MNHGMIMRKRLFALALVSAAAFAQTANAQSAGWVKTSDAVFGTASTAQLQFHGAADPSQPVSIHVALKLNNEAALDSLIAAQQTPGNPSYHKWLAKGQAAQNFGPTAAQAQAVASYLTQNGFANVQIAANNMSVKATGTVALAQQAFNTQIGAYSDSNGVTGIAPMIAVQVPSGLSQVNRVLGLDTMRRVHTQAMPPPNLGNQGGGNNMGYYPDGFATVYDTGGATAANTTVAIIGSGDMTAPNADLTAMEQARGITPVPTEIVAVGGSSTDESGRDEWSMDAQAIVGITGSVKKLIFYTGGDVLYCNPPALLQLSRRISALGLRTTSLIRPLSTTRHR